MFLILFPLKWYFLPQVCICVYGIMSCFQNMSVITSFLHIGAGTFTVIQHFVRRSVQFVKALPVALTMSSMWFDAFILLCNAWYNAILTSVWRCLIFSSVKRASYVWRVCDSRNRCLLVFACLLSVYFLGNWEQLCTAWPASLQKVHVSLSKVLFYIRVTLVP